MSRPTHFWNEYDRLDWLYRGPSRRLRKLYRELAAVDAAIAAVRASDPMPDHAPTSWQMIRERLTPLQAKQSRLIGRIAQLQNDEA